MIIIIGIVLIVYLTETFICMSCKSTEFLQCHLIVVLPLPYSVHVKIIYN